LQGVATAQGGLPGHGACPRINFAGMQFDEFPLRLPRARAKCREPAEAETQVDAVVLCR
jgi:hypothetical protein